MGTLDDVMAEAQMGLGILLDIFSLAPLVCGEALCLMVKSEHYVAGRRFYLRHHGQPSADRDRLRDVGGVEVWVLPTVLRYLVGAEAAKIKRWTKT